jgi:hypothetical protein
LSVGVHLPGVRHEFDDARIEPGCFGGNSHARKNNAVL